MIRIPSEHVQDVFARTRALITRCHPRLPGTPGCLRAAGELRDEFAKSCDRAFLEEYVQHPASFLSMNRVLAVVYLVAGSLFFLGGWGIYASAAVFTLGTVFFVNEFAFLGRFFDPLFKQKPGANVVGILEPAGPVERQMVLCAHHDATRVCNFLEMRPALFAFRSVLPIIFHAAANIGTVIASVGLMSGEAGNSGNLVIKIVIVAGCLFVVPLFRYFGRDASPGASDNLVSSLMLVKLAELFKSGVLSLPKNTRLVFLSADGEENGQRGSFEYARRHKTELLSLPTFVFNIDTLSRLEDLAFLKTDTNGIRKLSAPLADQCVKIAAGLGYRIKAVRFPFGGGGTDAGQFAKIGIEAASLIGISTRLIRKDIDYHTSRDTVDNIDPAAIEAGLNIAANFISNS